MKKYILLCFALLATLGTKAMETKSFTLTKKGLNQVVDGKFTYTIENEGTFIISGNVLAYNAGNWLADPSIEIPTGTYNITCTPATNKRVKITSVTLKGSSQSAGSTVIFPNTSSNGWWLSGITYTTESGNITDENDATFNVITAGVYLKTITINYELYTGLALDESETYDAAQGGATYDFLTLKRTLSSNWGTLCLPISLSSTQVATLFGEGTQVAKMTGTDGDIINFTTEYPNIEANVPCLIKVATAGSTYTLDEPVTTETAYNVPSTEKGNAKLIGTYAANGYVPTGKYFLSGGKFYKAADESNSIRGLRAYFECNFSGSGVKAYSFVVNDNAATAIEGIDAGTGSLSTGGDVYTLGGQLVRKNATSLAGLPKGIYIVNGKKQIVR